MPDHLHLLVAIPPDKILSQVVGLWKRAISRKLSIPWQRSFFDHRLRNEENFGDKCEYILHNPVRAGLVERAEDWPYTWLPEPPPLGTAAATSSPL